MMTLKIHPKMENISKEAHFIFYFAWIFYYGLDTCELGGSSCLDFFSPFIKKILDVSLAESQSTSCYRQRVVRPPLYFLAGGKKIVCHTGTSWGSCQINGEAWKTELKLNTHALICIAFKKIKKLKKQTSPVKLKTGGHVPDCTALQQPAHFHTH